jgi:hypothetical protein
MCVCLPAVLFGWVVHDLSATGRHDLSDFDPHEVARLETAAWRSYYAHQKLHLFLQMGELLRTEYHMPFWRSWVASYHAAHAAVVFQPGHNRAEYEHALPDLIRFFAVIHQGSATDFSVDHVARLELEWWIVHRERAGRQPGDLERALADVQAEIYRQTAIRFEDHAKARAEAMTVRDTHAEAGSVSEDDWDRIHTLLDRAWVSLRASVANTDGA